MRQMWNGYRWWKRGTEETQKGIPLILIESCPRSVIYHKGRLHVWPRYQHTGEKWKKKLSHLTDVVKQTLYEEYLKAYSER